MTAGGALGLGRADHPSLADDATDRRAALFLSADGRIGRARLFPALRLDRYAPALGDARTAISPQLGLNVRLFASDALRLKVSAGRAFRMPTLNDRFWQPGGNPDLKPERGWTLDGGIAWTAGRTRFELTAFASAARDQIVWRPTDAGYWAPENVARTRTRGLEASADVSAPLARRATAEAGLAATLTDARDRSDRASPSFDRQLRYVPRWTAKAWGGLALARVVGGALRLDAGAQAIGRRPTASDASRWLPAYVVLDGQVRYTRDAGRIGVTLALAVENLSDARYEVVQSYPMPPRHLRVRLLLETR